MNRITDANLNAIVARINRMTNSPAESWITLPDGRRASAVGSYHLDHAYGGVALHRMCNTAGGTEDVLTRESDVADAAATDRRQPASTARHHVQ